MNKKIFNSCFFTSLFVLLVSVSLIFGVLFDYYEGQILRELESEAYYISHAVENEGTSYIESFKNNEKRITLVSPEGKVLADTSADASALDNHADRSEIKQAMEEGSAMSSRYSNTLMQKNLYYAVKMNDGNILRVSTTQNSVVVILLGLMHPLAVIIVIALIISIFLSQRLSKAIIKPINNLDLENPASAESYDELAPLLKKLSAQKKMIDRQIKEANQKKEEFRLITENMREGLLVLDNAANVLTYNKAAAGLLEATQINGGSVFLLNRTKGFRNVIEKALGGERAESDIVLSERSYNLIASPVLEEGKIIGAAIVIIDVTERAKREQLRREFTSNVSHELKTPLTSISGFAEMMKAGGTPDDTVVDFSTSIYDEAQRLITLVSDIIKISELDENGGRYEKENVDLFELSTEVIKRLKPFADKQNITLKLSGGNSFVLGTRKILDEMIYNLCDNAIKYNRENGSVEIIINYSEGKVSLCVKDTGIGIPFNEQGRIFERFYRVDKSHSRLVGGTGLGLSIVKHGAIYHGADINLESFEGKGTSVTITFTNPQN